ncbi:MAG: hypothetical protein R2777_03625 [Chitinophagales bacterium]
MRKLLAVLSIVLIGIYAATIVKSCKADGKTRSFYNVRTFELALLMKQMHAQSVPAWKQLIEQDSFNIIFPVDFMGIYTVEPTDSFLRVRDDNFIGFADEYIASVKTLIGTKKQNKQIKRYNATIDACINCHNDYCQGPIDKIEKLYIGKD